MNRGEGARDDMRGASKKGSAHARAHLPALVLVGLILAGCPSTPEVRYTPIEVEVPVKIPCAVNPPAEPKWAVGELPADADDFTIAKAYRSERRQREQYNREMLAAIATCAKGKP